MGFWRGIAYGIAYFQTKPRWASICQVLDGEKNDHGSADSGDADGTTVVIIVAGRMWWNFSPLSVCTHGIGL